MRDDWEHHPKQDEDREPLGHRRWADLISWRRPVDDHTRLLPIITPAMRFRGGDLRWDPRRRLTS